MAFVEKYDLNKKWFLEVGFVENYGLNDIKSPTNQILSFLNLALNLTFLFQKKWKSFLS